MIKVKATKLGYYDLKRRKEGDVFMVEEKAFSYNWMQKMGSQPSYEEDDEAPRGRVQPSKMKKGNHHKGKKSSHVEPEAEQQSDDEQSSGNAEVI